MAVPKIVWPHFQSEASFSLEEQGFLLNNKAFFFPNLPMFELAFLNSSAGWFLLSSIARIKRGGFIEAEAQYVGQIPSLAGLPASQTDPLSELARRATAADAMRLKVVSQVRHRILDFRGAGPVPKAMSRKLRNWWEIDFGTFRREVKKTFGRDVPVAERGDWEAYLSEEAANVRTNTHLIERVQSETELRLNEIFEMPAGAIDPPQAQGRKDPAKGRAGRRA